jgi:hypothetical protein
MCIKICATGNMTCGILSHVNKCNVLEQSAFIYASDTSVYSSPYLQVDVLSKPQVAKFASMKQTAREWEKEVNRINAGEFPEWLLDKEDVNFQENEQDNISNKEPAMDLLSPVACERKQGIFDIVPSLSFDSASSDKSLESCVVEASLEDKVATLDVHLRRLRDKLVRPFNDIEASYVTLVGDMNKINSRVKELFTSIGAASLIRGKNYNTIWGAVQAISVEVTSLESDWSNISNDLRQAHDVNNQMHEDLMSTKDEVIQLKNITQHLTTWSSSIDSAIGTFQR